MAKLSTDELIESFKAMTLIELSEFVKLFEDTFDVTAAAPVAAAGSGNGNRSRSGDIEGVFEQLHELGELDEGHCLERLDELVSAELCHGGSSFLVIRSYAVSGVNGGSRIRERVASALVATRGDVFVALDDGFCRRLEGVL